MNSCLGFVDPLTYVFTMATAIGLTALVVGLLSGLAIRNAEIKHLKEEINTLKPF